MSRSHSHTHRVPVSMPSQPYCADCVGRLLESVEALEGVESAEVDPRSSMMTVVHDLSIISEEGVEHEALRLGMEISGRVAHAAYRLTGLD